MNVSKEWVIKNALNPASEILHCPCSVKQGQFSSAYLCTARNATLSGNVWGSSENLWASDELWLSISQNCKDAFPQGGNSSALAPLHPSS